MKRRRLIQYAGLSGLGLLGGLGTRAMATTLSAPEVRVRNLQSILQSFDFEVAIVDRTGQEVKRQSRQANFFVTELDKTDPSTMPLTMVAIPEGKFAMGAASEERQISAQELPVHRVTVQSFFMSKHPITQGQWQAVSQLPQVNRALSSSPAHFSGHDHPVESVSWLEAVEFCDRLSRHTGETYRLPSEAEWEYACRAGMSTPFHAGATLTHQLANYNTQFVYAAEPTATYLPATTPVGSFPPNAFGLTDMHGNVWEWCADQWHDSYQGAPKNSQAWVNREPSPLRSLRGGSWADHPAQARSASRSGYPADALNRMIGFRVAMGAGGV